MEKTLKEFLNENHKRKNKDKLVSIINGLNVVLGEEKFANVTGYQLSELDDLSKSDLLGIIDQFEGAYKKNWEPLLKKSSVNGLSALGFDDFFAEMSREDFSIQFAPGEDFAAELASLDFANLIGGPLDACVTAQNNASLATVNFIKEVGFKEVTNTSDPLEIRTVDFTHNRMIPNPDYNSETDPISEATIPELIALKVPFISLLNVPSFRIETCEVDFNVKLNSVYTKNINTELELEASLGIETKKVKFAVSAAYKQTTSKGFEETRQYTMGVKVMATNDSMPSGLENVLGILAG